jgi:hypothetical protein
MKVILGVGFCVFPGRKTCSMPGTDFPMYTTALANSHTCTLAHLPPYIACNLKNDCYMGCSWNVTDTRAVCPLWSATTHASLQFIGCLAATERNEEHVTGKMSETRLARLCEPRLQASAYLCSCFV